MGSYQTKRTTDYVNVTITICLNLHFFINAIYIVGCWGVDREGANTGRQTGSPTKVYICATEYKQLGKTCTFANLSRINTLNRIRILFSLRQHTTSISQKNVVEHRSIIFNVCFNSLLRDRCYLEYKLSCSLKVF